MQDASLFRTLRSFHRDFKQRSAFELKIKLMTLLLCTVSLACIHIVSPNIHMSFYICTLTVAIWLCWRIFISWNVHVWLNKQWITDSRAVFSMITLLKDHKRGPESMSMHKLSLAWHSLLRKMNTYEQYRTDDIAASCMTDFRTVCSMVLEVFHENSLLNEKACPTRLHAQIHRIVGLSCRLYR